jgi:hypothetical protein
VALVDDQILKSLTPDQLESRAARAERRRQRSRPERDGRTDTPGAAPVKKPAEWRRLELRIQGPADAARRAVEPVLEASVKRWEFLRAVPNPGGGGDSLQYRVRLKKSVPAEDLLQSVRTGAGPQVTNVELAEAAR